MCCDDAHRSALVSGDQRNSTLDRVRSDREVRRGTVVGTREGTDRGAVGGAGSGVGDPQGDQPVTVGNPEIHQQAAAPAEAGTEAVAAAAVAGRTRRDLAGPGGW